MPLTHRNKLHANNSIFCSDFLSHIQPSGISWHIISFCDFPTITPWLYFSSWCERSLLVLAKMGEKNAQRKWQVTFSFSQRSKPCLRSPSNLTTFTHHFAPPPRLEKHASLLRISSSGQLIPIWMQMHRGKCLDTPSFASKYVAKVRDSDGELVWGGLIKSAVLYISEKVTTHRWMDRCPVHKHENLKLSHPVARSKIFAVFPHSGKFTQYK